jgi:hypothetical protein
MTITNERERDLAQARITELLHAIADTDAEADAQLEELMALRIDVREYDKRQERRVLRIRFESLKRYLGGAA